MGRLFEDILCGAIGYGLGSMHDHKVSEVECEKIVNVFLRQTSLEDVIDFWMQDNGYTGGCEGYVCDKLRDKADQIENK